MSKNFLPHNRGNDHPTFLPVLRDPVHADGYGEEVFIVAQVDYDAGWADLACVQRVGCLIGIPLGTIRRADNP